jgi:hypothetical protein
VALLIAAESRLPVASIGGQWLFIAQSEYRITLYNWVQHLQNLHSITGDFDDEL